MNSSIENEFQLAVETIKNVNFELTNDCLLYTSDAADEV